MAYGASDPATDRRIVRQSLLSTVGRLYNNDSPPPTPERAIEIARIWEAYVYEGTPAPTGNGTETFAPAMPVPTLPYVPSPASVPLCDVCGAALTPVTFKKGNVWTVEQLANLGREKYGQVLCKQHYFGKKPVA